MKDYYYILGISKDANIDEIKKAFKKLSLKFHPDKNPGDTYFENRFKEVLEAYEILSNERSRANYDSSIYDKSSDSAKQSSNSFIILWKSNVIKRYLKFKLIFIIGIITPGIFYLIYLFCMFLINLQNERNLANLMQEFSGVWMLDHIKYKGYNHWGNTICYPQTIEFDKKGMFKRTDLRLNNIIDSFTFKVNGRSISLFRKDNTEFLTNIQFERTFDTLIIKGYENDDTIELKMSKRKLYPRSIKRKKLSVDEFRVRMEVSRRLIDDDSLYCEGIKGIVETPDSLMGFESELYENGKDISILLALNHISADYLIVPFANQILENSNRKFYAIEKSTSNYLGYSGLQAIFWMIGYTHPQAELIKFYSDSKLGGDYENATILKNIAIKYDEYYQSRSASSSGMTYSEIAVNHIHYDLKIPKEAKESIYSELAEKLKGHGKANLYYCWYLLNKDNKLKSVENRKLLENIISILEKIGGYKEHNELLQNVMDELIKNEIN